MRKCTKLKLVILRIECLYHARPPRAPADFNPESYWGVTMVEMMPSSVEIFCVWTIDKPPKWAFDHFMSSVVGGPPSLTRMTWIFGEMALNPDESHDASDPELEELIETWQTFLRHLSLRRQHLTIESQRLENYENGI